MVRLCLRDDATPLTISLAPVDVRNIISDDDSLQEGVLPALREYNLAQFSTVEVPGTDHQVRSDVHWYDLLGVEWRCADDC